MTLSDLTNNAATAAVMCPTAIGAAGTLGVGADPYLMAAVGASCAFRRAPGPARNRPPESRARNRRRSGRRAVA